MVVSPNKGTPIYSPLLQGAPKKKTDFGFGVLHRSNTWIEAQVLELGDMMTSQESLQKRETPSRT